MSKQTERNAAKMAAVRKLTPLETHEMLSLMNRASTFEEAAILVARDSMRVPEGKTFAKQLQATADLMKDNLRMYVVAKLQECGYPSNTKARFNPETGQFDVL